MADSFNNNLTEAQMALLNQLHDIQLPDPVGWWPLAYSWWVLIFSAAMALIGVAWYFLDQRRRNTYRRKAMQQLQQIMLQSEPTNQKIGLINQLLKQVALTAYGRQSTAQLYEKKWLEFLQQHCEFIDQPQQLLEISQRQYQAENSSNNNGLDSDQVLALWHDYAEKWIKGHHQ